MHTLLRCGIVTLLIPAWLATSASSRSSEPNRLTPEEIAEGWLLLFDGESLFGWRAVAEADWTVADGAIAVTSGQLGLLRTTTQFSDYVLNVDFRAAPGTNSGVFLRTSPAPTSPREDCYEVNIADGGTDFTTASLVGRKTADVPAAPDQWHTLQMRADGDRIQIQLDGHTAVDYQDPAPLGRGFIGLQHNQGKVEFQNIKLKPLNLDSLFNGRDLSGWVTYPDMASVFSVTPEGYLHAVNGRGQLETKQEFGDFVLQLQCQTNGQHLNSGIFFRCIPGEVMMGYESQIHNAFHDNDRTRPVDCGTGGIFRRKDARKVMSDDFTWFTQTIVAEGPHIAVWVEGVQVTDWSDQRKEDENPRRGRRLKPGTIMIQGHDPTTDILFRNLQAAELSPRRPQA